MTDEQSTETSYDSSGEPQRIGPYRILQKIGEGGMGIVYGAEQEEPVRRKVALKLIKWGMDTKQVVARFESERQALALMNHPNIARVFDAGATDQGRPYFAMEFVKGESITRYCDRQRLSTRERLELFMQVCDGVQHAHQKGIIHRDIKASNVLVMIQDDKPVPKIIDFGVAKATEQRLTERTVFTELGQLIGTPEYMSPEQAEMTVQDIDTRTDVYSLGVLLYELLVGALPFELSELREAGFDEIRRMIREDEPSKPSTRISTVWDASLETAKRRRTDLPSLRKQLQGDMDWITMKALEKDRTRRYGSPSELSADLGRHLKHEPVVAGPPSTAYRTGKFVRRHRIAVTIAAAAVLLLVGFAVWERIQSRRIAKEAATAKQVSEFLVGLFEVSDPSEARGNSITAREILDKGAKEIDEGLSDQPEIQARLMATMGFVYRNLGLYTQAQPLLKRSLEIRRRMLGDDHPDTLTSILNMGELLDSQGKQDEAQPLYLEAFETSRRVLGEDHPETLRSMDRLASVYMGQGRFEESETLLQRALDTRRRVQGDDHPDTLQSMNTLAIRYAIRSRNDEAEPLFLESLETGRRVLGDDHPSTLLSMVNLAVLYLRQDRDDEAESLLLETLDTGRRVWGDDHPQVLMSMVNLATLYTEQGRNDEAEPLLLEALETGRRVLGDDNPRTLFSMVNLAVLYTAQGRYDEAEPLYLETLETQKRVRGDHHVETRITLYDLASFEALRGNLSRAMDWLRQSVEAGYAGADGMSKDSDFETLHGPEFDALVEGARRNAVQQGE